MSLVIDVGSSFYRNRMIGSNEDGKSVEDEDGCVSDAETSSIGESSVSSVGSCSSDEAEDDKTSKKKKDCFDSIDSLDGSLPLTRGLSNFFNGKSKSFATLSDVVTNPVTVADLAKQENPFNKKRRILMAKKASWPRRASCGSLNTACLPPLPQPVPNSVVDILSQVEEEEDDDDGDDEDGTEREEDGGEGKGSDICSSSFNSSSLSHGRKMNNNCSFRFPRSFSVGDLQRHFEC